MDFEKLIQVFIEKNTCINLSAIRDKENIKIKHIDDSLELLEMQKKGLLEENFFENKKIVDMGSGSGFPLLPLAMSIPESEFVGIDSVRKKVEAINDMIKNLELKNVNAVWIRAENFWKKDFDILTARAVAYIDKLFERSFDLVKPGWYFVFYKIFSPAEFEDMQKILSKKGMLLIQKYHYQLFEWDIDRVIYIIQK